MNPEPYRRNLTTGAFLGTNQPCYSDAGCGPDRPERQVDREVNRLREMIAINGKLIEDLDARLAPLVPPMPTAALHQGDTAPTAMAPLAATLYEMSRALEATNRRLDFLLGNVEI